MNIVRPLRISSLCARALLVSALLALSAPASVRAQSGYTIQDIGRPETPRSTSKAYDINSTGQVVGSEDAVNSFHTYAFLYSNGIVSNLEPPGQTDSFAQAINNAGQIVGTVQTAFVSRSSHAFLYSNGKMADLGTFGGPSSGAFGINGTGQVVGGAQTVGEAYHAFLYSNGKMTDLGTLGGTESIAYGINDAAQVVGNAYNLYGSYYYNRAFLYSSGKMTDLGTLGGRESIAYAINNAGQVVGNASTPLVNDGYKHAFLYSNGKMTDLGTFPGGKASDAFDINNAGQVVGTAGIIDGRQHGFFYSNGRMFDLNLLLPAKSGWEFWEARAINDKGQIVGYGRHNGAFRPFLLTPPVPRLTGFTLSPPGVPSGLSTTATATLSVQASGMGSRVSITYGSAIVGTVNILAGARSGTTLIRGGTPGIYRLSAKLGSVILPATLTVTAPVVTGFSLSPASVPTGGKSTATVLLSGPAGAGGVQVPILYNTLTLATASIAPGATTGTATLTAGRPGVFSLSARLGSVTKSVVWTVTPAPVTVLVKNDASAPMGFAFTAATVKAGTPVTWLNQSSGLHSVVWDSRVPASSPLPGANIAAFSAGTRSATWTAPLVTTSTTYHYHCGIHGTTMAGTILVTP